MGHRHDHHLDPGRPGRGVHCRGSPQRRVRRHPRRPPRHPLRGARTTPAGRAPAFRRLCQGRGCRALHPPRPWQPVHVRRVPGRAGVPGCRKLPGLRQGTGRQRLRGAVHLYAEGEPALGCRPSTPSSSCAWRCWTSEKSTTPPGSSSGSDTERQLPLVRSCFHRRHSPRRLLQGVSSTGAGTFYCCIKKFFGTLWTFDRLKYIGSCHTMILIKSNRR